MYQHLNPHTAFASTLYHQQQPTGPNTILSLAKDLDISVVRSDHSEIGQESTRLIQVLTNIGSLNSHLNELTVLEHELTIRYQNFDLTDQQFLLHRLAMVREICQSLKEFAWKKGTILTKLQQPALVANALRIHKDYHQDFLELIQEIDSFQVDLELVNWCKMEKVDLRRLEEVLGMIPTINAKFRMYLETINQLRSLIANRTSK